MANIEVIRAHTNELAILGFRPAITDEQLALFPTPKILNVKDDYRSDLPLPVYLRKYENALEVGIDILTFGAHESFVDYSVRVFTALGNCAMRSELYKLGEHERTVSVFELSRVVIDDDPVLIYS